ncbi:MAG: hypothetical protein J6T61_00710 [Spirochaetia bacterium]|nr:hypothetical protein [Spirochaetia bacterium]
MRKTVLAFILFIAAASLCFGSGAGELGRSDFKILTNNIIKWKDHDIKSYSIKVVYAAGNRPDTLYEIKVVNKKVVSCLLDEIPIDNFTGANQYTIDAMHDSAKKLVKKNKKNAPMLYIVKYDETYGYITSLVRIYNPKAKAALKPEEFNYRIKVYDFFPEEPAKN